MQVSKSKRCAGVLYECISEGNWLTTKRFDGIFILSDKVAFMSRAAFTAIAGETTALKAPPAGRESVCIFNKPVSSKMFLLLSSSAANQSTFHNLAEAHLYQSIRIISQLYQSKEFELRFKEFSSAHQACMYLIQSTETNCTNCDIFLLFKITAFYLNIY